MLLQERWSCGDKKCAKVIMPAPREESDPCPHCGSKETQLVLVEPNYWQYAGSGTNDDGQAVDWLQMPDEVAPPTTEHLQTMFAPQQPRVW